MDLNEVRNLLSQLTALVGEWSASERISAVERDLALEKLRALYDLVRSGDLLGTDEASDAADFVPESVSVPIDLGEVLSLDTVSEASGETLPVAGVETQDTLPVEEQVGAAPESAAPENDLVPETVSEVSVVEEPVAEESIAEKLANAVSDPTAEAPKGIDPVPASATALEPPAEPRNEPQSVYAAPTLFGLEEQTVRHRHKQRVIMSLYDPEPTLPVRKAEPAEHPASAPVPTAEQPQPVREVPSKADTMPEVSDKIDSVPAAAQAEQAEGAPAPVSPVSDGTPSASNPIAATRPNSAVAGVAGAPAARFASEQVSSAVQPEYRAASGSVLGEVINQDVQTLADTISPPRDVASELRRSEPVTDLRNAVGINDRFLMIRDLFDGDAAAYEKAVERFNSFADLDECMIYIAENYAWNANSDGAKLLMELLERKFA